MTTGVSPSFATHFWGKDDRGCEVLINKMNQGQQTLEELLGFLKEKIAIEEDYSRRMMNLSRKFQVTGIYESGQLRESLDTMKFETEQASKSHYNESRKIKYDIYEKMETFLSNYKGKRKPIETSSENLLETKKMMLQNVNKQKERYQVEVTKLNTYLAQESLLLGKELDKNRDKIYKQQQTVSDIRTEYQVSCSKLEELNKLWIQKWSSSSANLQILEVERIQFLIKNLWEYANLVSSACVSDDTSCENIRKVLELCEPEKEIEAFVSKFQSGTKIYSTPRFVDFVNGELAINDGTNTVVQKFGDSRNTSSHTTSSHRSQHSVLAPLETTHQHLKLNQRTNLQRRPPPSDDGQTSISNPSTNSMLHRGESSYSNPTSISSFTDAVDQDLRSSQNWNSPSRRRSRNSDRNSISTKKSSSSNRRSFILDQKPTAQYVDLTTEDPLRATLEDLKIGGNGDMNKFKEYVTTSRPNSMIDPLASSISTEKSTSTTIRPKSTIITSDTPFERSYKRSSFQADLRSRSRSSVNLQARLSSNEFPNITTDGRRVIQHVKALYDFNASLEGELSFKEGDVLLVVHKQVDQWWECENVRTRESGLAPGNFVEECS